jgi:dipeptidase E
VIPISADRRLLLLSNSRDPEGRFLVHPRDALAEQLRGVRSIAFAPFASVGSGLDAYATLVEDAFRPFGVRIIALHREGDPAAAVRAADAIAVGGGNTFHLLAALQRLGLVDVIRSEASSGKPYVGWSAGSVVACPTLGTTNDMPIIAPASFDALGLVGFQINAHFTDAHPPGFQGETRRQRLQEFLAVNPSVPVIGVPEGDWLDVSGMEIVLRGPHPAPVLRAAHEDILAQPGDRLAWLLEPGA